MTLISRRFRLASAIVAGASIACAMSAAAQTRKPAPPGPAKAIELKAPLPDLKFNMTAAESLCTVDGKGEVSLIVTVVNAGKGVANFTTVPFQTVLAVTSWWIIDPAGKSKPASAPVVFPQTGKALVLGPGQEWTTTIMVVGLPKLGGSKQSKYGFEMLVDPAKGVAESDESNNIGTVAEPDPCFKK